jgi:hypothetical protein
MIKPGFFESKRLNSLSLESNYLFISLWIHSDDYGVCQYSIRQIAGNTFMHRPQITEKQCRDWIDELLAFGFIIRAEYDGSEYLIITTWEEHQRVPNPSQRRYIPDDKLKEIRDLFIKNRGSNEKLIEANEGLIRIYLCKDKRIKKKEESKSANNKFKPPTLDEVEAYSKEKNLEIDAQYFIDFYESKNWMVGKNKMSNWRAAARRSVEWEHMKKYKDRKWGSND